MLSDYIDVLRQSGKYSFSGSEAQKTLGISKAALSMAISRLRKKGAIISPYRNLYVPIPPEYRSIGCLPAEQLIPILMNHIKIPYYMCLLSAAAILGASHQRPQITQVMCSKRIHNIRAGSVAINFIYKKDISYSPTEKFTVPTGYLIISTPETTAMDLLLYPRQSGGINHIATILSELIEKIDANKLISLIKLSHEIAWVQRLGYITEQLDIDESDNKPEIINTLLNYINLVKPSFVPLTKGKLKKCIWNKTWRIIINSKIESDI